MILPFVSNGHSDFMMENGKIKQYQTFNWFYQCVLSISSAWSKDGKCMLLANVKVVFILTLIVCQFFCFDMGEQNVLNMFVLQAIEFNGILWTASSWEWIWMLSIGFEIRPNERNVCLKNHILTCKINQSSYTNL